MGLYRLSSCYLEGEYEVVLLAQLVLPGGNGNVDEERRTRKAMKPGVHFATAF